MIILCRFIINLLSMDISSLNAQYGLMRAGTPLMSEGQPMYVCSFNALNSGSAAVASLILLIMSLLN